MEKEKYSETEIEIIRFTTDDVLAGSPFDDNELPGGAP